MANTNNTRRTHSTPGVYFNEAEITYSSKSLGITTLGVAGETLRGPAFQPITIDSWRKYQTTFGGTSTAKFRGSQYPKYELPYIAKSYLEQSQQLEVVRVLGLSGVNAGPAWVITATKNVLGEKNVYDKISYAPTDVTEDEWIWSGASKNAFLITDTLPSYITNPTSSSPNYYKQIYAYDRPEIDCAEIGQSYDWTGRLFNTVSAMYADTTLHDGYAKVVSGLGYEYQLMSSAPSPTTWTKGVNWFCELPTAAPGENSPSPIKVGCNYGYTLKSTTPSPMPLFTEGYNWFNNMDYVSREYESDQVPSIVKVNESEYVNVVAPYVLNSTNANSVFYVGDVAYILDNTKYYFGIWDETAKEYVKSASEITSTTTRVYKNGVYYDFFVLNGGNTYYFYNGTTYTTADSIPNVNLGEYIKLIDAGNTKVYHWKGNAYALIDYVNSASYSTVVDWNTSTARPNLSDIVIPYNEYVSDKPNINNLYRYTEIQKYDLGTELTGGNIPSVYTTFFKNEEDATGGAKDVRLLLSDITDNPALENARICTPKYVSTSVIPATATDLGYGYAVSSQEITSLAVDKGEYVSLNTKIEYVGTGGTSTTTASISIADSTAVPAINTKVTGYDTGNGYNLSDLSLVEANDANDFQYQNWSTFNGSFATNVTQKHRIPTAVKVGNGYYKLKNIPEYFERTCSSPAYYNAEPIATYSIVITTPNAYYERGENVEYYQKANVVQCYEVKPICNYYKKELVSYQLDQGDTECCEENLDTVVGVLRSRGEHKKAKFVRTPNAQDRANGICNDIYEYDGIEYYASEVRLEPSRSLTLGDECSPGYSATSKDFSIDSNNYGKFTIVVDTIYGETKRYSVSLNPSDKNYIYNVIGGNPEDGETEVYIEELYDVALKQMIDEGQANAINGRLHYYPEIYVKPTIPTVDDLLTLNVPTKKNLGRRYLYSYSEMLGLTVVYSTTNGNVEGAAISGYVYTVAKIGGNYRYVCYCAAYTPASGSVAAVVTPSSRTERITKLSYKTDVSDNSGILRNAVKVKSDDMFYIAMDDAAGKLDVFPITIDLNNYREPFRYSSTPWILSEIKGDAENVELVKLFRFHTISDGSNTVDEVKISIENIDPENGTFDVVVRDFNDTDYSPSVLERYARCNLVPGSSNYIALKIGSFDGTYETVSKYVTVEVNENDATESSIPAGFMGYPVRDWSGIGVAPKQMRYVKRTTAPEAGVTYVEKDYVPEYALEGVDDAHIKISVIIGGASAFEYYDLNDAFSVESPRKPWFKYNTSINEDVRIRKQYFGVSDLVGIDTDILKYKGVEAYNGVPNGMSACFHLDARILNGTPDSDGVITSDGGVSQTVNIDGVNGYSWVTVGMNNTTDYGIEPRIGDAATMRNTIYEDIRYRKFTVAMYGGFDGWDYYRTYRSNTDDFTYNNYKGDVDKYSGFGSDVSVLSEPEAYGLDLGSKCLNTDYYAYLGAIRQFANPRTVEINVLATPGIDYVNNGLLVDDVVEMVEEERSDALYVVTTPDKPFGASDSQSDMYNVDDAVSNLEASDIDSNRVCTYYPWEKYYDDTNYQYIFLPITRDVVKSIAYTDNITYPWYAPAGVNRGAISGVAPKRKLKSTETDTLYDGRINFVCSFAKEGDKIWGNKNLQVAESQLNRISTRRLLLRIKKLCDSACIGFIFDPNDNAMAKNLDSTLKNVLNGIKSNRGIYDYKVEVDTSAEARDRLELPATIYIKPTKIVEYIPITCVVTPQGVNWN